MEQGRVGAESNGTWHNIWGEREMDMLVRCWAV